MTFQKHVHHQLVYGFYDAQGQVRNVHLPKERHDFGPNKRQAVYDFFADIFALDRSMIDEGKVTIEPEEIMKTINRLNNNTK